VIGSGGYVGLPNQSLTTAQGHPICEGGNGFNSYAAVMLVRWVMLYHCNCLTTNRLDATDFHMITHSTHTGRGTLRDLTSFRRSSCSKRPLLWDGVRDKNCFTVIAHSSQGHLAPPCFINSTILRTGWHLSYPKKLMLVCVHFADCTSQPHLIHEGKWLSR
jgi:hypothetical protein